MNITLLITLILDYVHSLYFCLKVFAFKDAIKVPINISRNVKIGSVYHGCIVLPHPIRHNMLFLGHQGYDAIAETQGLIHISPGGKVIVEGNARLGQGVRLWIDSGATLRLGDNFYCNKNCLLRVYDDVTFGRDVLMGWNIEVNTTDGHTLILKDQEKENHASVLIGNHVWIASNVTITKGAELPNDCVVAGNTLVNSKFLESKTLIGGIPAKILKRDISWRI